MSSYDSYRAVKTLFVLGTTTSALCSGGLLFTSYMHVPGYTAPSSTTSPNSSSSLVKQWQTMGSIGSNIVPPLTLLATGAHFANAYLTHTQPQGYRFLAAGVLSLAVLPYTFAVLAETNAELGRREGVFKEGGEGEGKEKGEGLEGMDVSELIRRWGKLSAVRGWMLLASALVGFDAMVHLTF